MVRSPSLPPASWIITRTGALRTPSRLAVNTARAKASGTAAEPAARAPAPTPNTNPARVKSRLPIRSIPFSLPLMASLLSHASFEIELGRRKDHQPPLAVRIGLRQPPGGRGAQHTVQMKVLRAPRGRQAGQPV